VAAADFATSAAAMDHLGRREGARLAMIQHAVARALDSVGVDASQEAKAHDIVAANFAEVASDADQRDAPPKQALELLAAPTLDHAAFEKLGSEAVAGLEARVQACLQRPSRHQRPAHTLVRRATRRKDPT
jgi:protein CpxP